MKKDITNLIDREATGAIYQLEDYERRVAYPQGKAVRKQLEELLERLGETHDVRRIYDGRNLRWVAFPKGTAGEGVSVTCYRETEVWYDRSNAMDFYEEAYHACEGSERERYGNVFMDLYEGRSECSDSWGR